MRWEARIPAPKQYFFHGDVFIGPDRIIASADVDVASGIEGGLHAFDIQSGQQLWAYHSGRGVLGAVTGADGRAVVYTAAGDLVALNVKTGDVEWSHAIKAPPWESPGTFNSRVFAGSTDGSLYAIDAVSGGMAWQKNVGSPVTTSVRATDLGVFFGTADGALHRLSSDTGERLSSLTLDTVLTPASAPLVTSDGVFVLLVDRGADHRALVSADPALKAVTWRQTAPDRWSTTRVFTTGGMILLGTPDGSVMAYCSGDGSPAWSHKVAAAPIRAIGASSEMLYVGTTRGILYAIRAPNSCSR